MENLTGDNKLAKRMKKQFNKEILEISSDEEKVCVMQDSLQQDYQLALKLQSQYEKEAIELLSDSDDDVVLQAVETAGSSVEEKDTKNNYAVDTDAYHSFHPEPTVARAEPIEPNSGEFFIEELQTYVNPELNFDWKFIDVIPNLRDIFKKFDEQFFQSRFNAKNFVMLWSDTMGSSCTNRNFNDDSGRYTIALNGPLLSLRPRIQIISIILHEMIHAFLKMEGIKEPNNGHGNNFRKIMTFFNSKLHTSISFNHKLNDASVLCRTQWYRCTGICHNYQPFHGVVRSIEGPPGLHNEWWKEHAETCGGTFFKIYELCKTERGETATRYAVNVKYMLPKRENICGRIKTRLPPKKSIDLTTDVPSIVSTTSCEIIPVDTDGSSNTSASSVVADQFIANFCRTIAFTRDAYDMQCPICQDRIKRKLFRNHIDGCKGFVRQLSWKKSTNGKIVQNGLLELKANPELQSATTSPRPLPYSESSISSVYGSYQQAKRKRFG